MSILYKAGPGVFLDCGYLRVKRCWSTYMCICLNEVEGCECGSRCMGRVWVSNFLNEISEMDVAFPCHNMVHCLCRVAKAPCGMWNLRNGCIYFMDQDPSGFSLFVCLKKCPISPYYSHYSQGICCSGPSRKVSTIPLFIKMIDFVGVGVEVDT